MRQVVLDTETTGLSPQSGHRLTEIGCVEIINRKISKRVFQTYLNPDRELDAKAAEITGLSWSMLRDKPRFHEKVDELLEFIDGAELIIHNAPFDLGFLDNELALIKHPFGKIAQKLSIIDTLLMSREIFPGQKNNLDSLCKRYMIDNSHRAKHGALLDAEILAHVYLAMTAGQTNLELTSTSTVPSDLSNTSGLVSSFKRQDLNLKIIYADEQEQAAHAAMLALMKKQKK